MEEYDISLAVQAVRTLSIETHTNEDCQKFVWYPTRFWLEMLAKENPSEIYCLHEEPISNEEFHGQVCHVYAVVAEKKIVYLGTAINKKKALFDFYWLVKRLNRKKATQLEKKGPFAMMRLWSMCTIPINEDTLTQESIQEGVRRFLHEFAPELGEIPIVWLPKRQRQDICWKIFSGAKASAVSQTKKERLKIITKDL